eukprot:924429_1
MHSSACSASTPLDCNVCTMESAFICITGTTSYNDWFYTQYEYSGCYGDNPYYHNATQYDYGGCYGDMPYYHNATNNQYIYWNYDYNRWHSYTTVGSNSNTAYAYPSTGESLYATNGKWSVNSPIISRNTDICLEIHSSSCRQANISAACNCDSTVTSYCITGTTSYNDWFYTDYDYGGCYGDKPYYYNNTNNHYIYWNHQLSRWHAYTTLGSNGNTAYAYPSTGESLQSTNGRWSVNSPPIGTNTDPCLEMHSSACSASTPLDCNVCTMESAFICITGTTSYNDWFYTQYEYSGCYGDNPYYHNATNNQYIYWNYQYNRWHSYTTVGSNGDTAYAYPSTGESLYATNGKWSVNSPIISRNTDICLEIHSSSCRQANISAACNCDSTITS